MRRSRQGGALLSVAQGFASQAVVLISGVVVARTLGVEDRGQVALLTLAPVLLSNLGTLGMPLAATYHIARTPGAAASTVRSLVRPALAQCALLVPVHVLLLVVLVDDGPDVKAAGLLSLVMTPVAIGLMYGLAVLQGMGDFRRFYGFGLVGPLLYTLAILALAAAGAAELVTVTLAFVLAHCLALAGTLIGAARALPAGESEPPPPLRTLLRFGLKAIPGAASPIEYFRVDQALVAFFLSPVAMGLYVSAIAFTNLPRFVANNLGQLAYPRVAAERRPAAQGRLVWRFTAGAALVSGAIVIVLEVLAADLLRLFFGSEFVPAAEATRILLLAAFLLAVRRVLSDAARGAGLPSAGSIAEGVSWLAFGAALLVRPPQDIVDVAWALTAAVGAAVTALLCIVLRWRLSWSGHAADVLEGGA